MGALRIAVLSNMKSCGKNLFCLSFSVFRTLVLIEDTIFTSPTGDGTAILRGHPSYAKVFLFSELRLYLHFSVILRPCRVLVRSRKSNPRPPALQSSALITELILPQLELHFIWCNIKCISGSDYQGYDRESLAWRILS